MPKFNEIDVCVRPFVKWVGGKRQLLPEIIAYLPDGVGVKYTKYVEPFVGGGAVLFELLRRYSFEQVVINDMNVGLINAYNSIKLNVEEVIELLQKLQDDYYSLQTLDLKQQMFYDIRTKYNEFLQNERLQQTQKSLFASYFIFLNKTCFNGMYRVNSKGLYNVPFGKAETPTICDVDNLRNVSVSLKNVIVLQGSYERVEEYVDNKTLVYFDPPYRPITKTATFTAYTGDGFSDSDQIALAQFTHKLSQKGASILLSNSDPKNTDVEDDFFDRIYEWATICKVNASRAINSNGKKRGKINEILVRC